MECCNLSKNDVLKAKKKILAQQATFYALLGSVHQTHQVVFLIFDGPLTAIFDATKLPQFLVYPYMLTVIIATHMGVWFYLCCQKIHRKEDKEVAVPSTSQLKTSISPATVLQSLENSGRLLPAKNSRQPCTSSKNVLDTWLHLQQWQWQWYNGRIGHDTGMSYDYVLIPLVTFKIENEVCKIWIIMSMWLECFRRICRYERRKYFQALSAKWKRDWRKYIINANQTTIKEYISFI